MIDYLTTHIRKLLSEEVGPRRVIDAIKKKKVVMMTYDANDGNPKGKGLRFIVMPVAYGLTKAGNPVVRAYQQTGDTERGVPKWKFFRLDRIKRWSPSGTQSFAMPPGYNTEDDASMSQVYVQAEFSDEDKKERKNLLKRTNMPRKQVQNNNKTDNVIKNTDANRENRIKELNFVSDFGDTNNTTTDGVIYKNTETDNAVPQEPKYDEIKKSGVVYKNDEINYVDDVDNKESEHQQSVNNNSNNLNYVDDIDTEEQTENNEEEENKENGHQ